MTLLSRLQSARFSSKCRREYEKKISEPNHRLISTLLNVAIQRHADAICFGFQPNIVGYENFHEAWPLDVKGFIDTRPNKLADDPSDQSAMTRNPSGLAGLPISMRINGNLEHFDGLPFDLYGRTIAGFQSGLVSLGASETNPQPVRYIEIGYALINEPPAPDTSGRRRFAEVDLEFQNDNTFWVHIRGVREIEAGVRISGAIF
jgi:hypothetical protein